MPSGSQTCCVASSTTPIVNNLIKHGLHVKIGFNFYIVISFKMLTRIHFSCKHMLAQTTYRLGLFKCYNGKGNACPAHCHEHDWKLQPVFKTSHQIVLPQAIACGQCGSCTAWYDSQAPFLSLKVTFRCLSGHQNSPPNQKRI